MNQDIEHKGIISDIQNNLIRVTIVSKSMCASCHAKGACISGDSKEKIIEVKTSDTSNYKPGDEVVVCMKNKIGVKAVLIGFFFPFIILIATFILTYIFLFDKNEVMPSLLAIFTVGIYYFIIYLLRNRIEKNINFYIK
ncbi:MAG TPA: hypothetical protein DD434_07795 [Bacteroidales bacterium]|nr:hypothetical protein [Bacteroidales bacterium]